MAFAPMTGPYAQIPATFARLYGWIASRGLEPTGAPTGVYLSDPAEGEARARWELQAPLAGNPADAAPDASGCGIKRIAARMVASTVHRGPYDQVAAAHGALAAWAKANGFVIAGPPEERYLSEPGTPPEGTVTEVRLPVARG